MPVHEYIELLQLLPQDFQVISYGDRGMPLRPPEALLVHAKEQLASGAVLQVIKGYGTDYVVVVIG